MVPYPIFALNEETSRHYIENLCTEDNTKCYEALNFIKNCVIGSNRQKGIAIANGILPKLLQVLPDQSKTPDIRLETVVILGSLAKGTKDQVKTLADANVVTYIINAFLIHDEPKFIEACLRCISIILQFPFADYSVVFSDLAIIRKLIKVIDHNAINHLTNHQEYISNSIYTMSIFSYSCRTGTHQKMLWDEGIYYIIGNLLNIDLDNLSIATLKCLACVCKNNVVVSSCLAKAEFNGKLLAELLDSMQGGDRPTTMRIAASKCITYLYRAKALEVNDSKVKFGALPTLVRLCQNDQNWEQRVEAAETLAVLIERDVELQSLASISNHLLQTLSEFVNHPINPLEENSGNFEEREHRIREMKQAAFKVFASLGANHEEIRKRIIETDNFTHHIWMGLTDICPKVQLSAVRVVHSLSRSVQQLRTTFKDHSLWKPLMTLLESPSDEIQCVTSSTLCNLALEFSPSKEPIVDSEVIEFFCNLIIKKKNPSLRLNGICALMNMAYQSDFHVKTKILNTLGTDQILNLLSDTRTNVLMKTLGLLRNLLFNKHHIDYIMNLYGDDIIKAVLMILQGDHSPEVKEQALCVLGNIADGKIAKNYIMNNNEILKKIEEYMTHGHTKLQMGAIICISNLVRHEERGAADRQAKFKEMGIFKLLQHPLLMTTSDSLLLDKVKTTLAQFSKS